MIRLLHEFVTRTAGARPDSLAMIGSDRTVTYRELDEYSNRLAATLRAHGCERGGRVAVLMPHTTTTVASLVGILKAGCAYVPLDPSTAIERAVEMVRQCEPTALLVGGGAMEGLDTLRSSGVLTGTAVGWLAEGSAPSSDVDFTLDDVERASVESVETAVDPDDLAYILFTSGTTGSPKGVPITHRSASVFIEWVVDYFELGPDDRMTGHTALTFDLSTFDIYAPFAAGAQLHLVPKQVRMLPHKVAPFIRERELTMWFSVPSQLAYVSQFDALEGENLPSLRHVVWCGDVLPTASLLYWKRRLPGVAFTNLYGPTETTVASSYYRIPDEFDDPLADIPIGTGCAGEELLVLDDQLQAVREGEVGDIYIRGVGLSPGYWGDPERTRLAFIPDPEGTRGPSAERGGRLYRTGDRGRVGQNGAVHFVGRADFQIKTAGYRVEPAEVENAILRLEQVSACTVVPITVDAFAGNAVGCVYVPSNGTPLRTGEAKKRLAQSLPGYMMPAKWLALDELPVDGRGKIDRARARELIETDLAVAPAPPDQGRSARKPVQTQRSAG